MSALAATHVAVQIETDGSESYCTATSGQKDENQSFSERQVGVLMASRE